MSPEDMAEMSRRLNQEELLHRTGFEPVLPDGTELWVKDLELYSRCRALVVALEELAGGERAGVEAIEAMRREGAA